MKNSLNISQPRYILTFLIMAAMVLPGVAQAFVTTSDMPIAATNMVPNSTVSGSFTVENTTGFAQKAGIQVASTTGDFALFADQMTFEISGDFVASGDLGDFTNPFALSTIPDGSSHSYTITLTLKSDAPQNPLMGKSLGFDLIVGLEEGTTQIVPVVNSTGGGGGSSRRSARASSPTPQVLGESIEVCEQLLYTTIRANRQNDVGEVMKLQKFLRDLEGHFNLELTGVYDLPTQQAVKIFQEKYRDKVLRPWGLPIPTMIVYITTRKMVNEIHCQFTKEFPLTADQEAEIAWYRSQGIAYRQATSPTGNVQGASTAYKGGDDSNLKGEEDDVAEVGVEGETPSSATKSTEPSFFGRVVNFFKSLFSR